MEHKRAVNSFSPNSKIVKHLSECVNCSPEWKQTTVLGKKKKDNFKRVIRETISIMRAGNCVNMPSLTLDEDAKAFLSV